MKPIEIELIQNLLSALDNGDEQYLFTVMAVQGASPRPVGSMMLFNKTQQSQTGSLSGGCIEEELLQSIGSGELLVTQPQVLSYGVTAEETARLGLPCGGEMKVIAEKLSQELHQECFVALLQALERRKYSQRVIDMKSGRNAFQVGCSGDPAFQALTLEGDTQLFSVFTLGPPFRLLLVGAGALAAAITRYAEPLGFQIELCDPRENMRQQWSQLGIDLEVSSMMPDDFVCAANCDKHTGVLTLSHDPRVDDMALMAALKTDASYVGALGSLQTSEKRRLRLAQLDLLEQEISRLHAPVGLNIGSKTPPEIAIAILADIIKQYRVAKV